MGHGLLELGAVLAAIRWQPAGTVPRSFLFLSATVVAALFAGLTVASGSRYLAWLAERARRLELERDQQATIAAAAERTRIARELHDIVSHSLSVVITLADAAAVVSGPILPAASGDDRGLRARQQALADMRALLGVLRTDEPAAELAPQPGLGELGVLVDGSGRPASRSTWPSRAPLPARRRGRADRLPDRPGGADQRSEARRGGARAGSTIATRARGRVRVVDHGPGRRRGGTAGRPPGTASTACASGPRCTAVRSAPGRCPGGGFVSRLALRSPLGRPA